VSANLRERLLQLLDGQQALVVDLARVGGIDSSGVAGLLEVYQRAHKLRKKLVLATTSDPVLRVLRMACLETIFTFAATVDEALAQLRRS
jgi:anti-anti-sigma factor